MKSKRILVYTTVFCVFVVLWTLVFWQHSLHETRDVGKQLSQDMPEVTTQMRGMLQQQSSDMLHVLQSHDAAARSSLDSLEDIAINLMEADADALYYAMDAQGTLYRDGALLHQQLDATTASQTMSSGMSISYLLSFEGRQDCLIIALRAAPTSPYGLAKVVPLRTFGETLLEHSPYPVVSSAFFVDGDRATVPLITDADTHELLAPPDAQTVPTTSAYTVEDAQQGMYDLYIPLDDAGRIVLGMRVRAGDILPVENHTTFVLLVVFAVGVTLFCAAIIYNLLTLYKTQVATNIRMPKDPLTNLFAGVNVGPAMHAYFARKASEGPCCLIAMDIVAFHRFNMVHSEMMGDKLLQVIGDYIEKNHKLGMRINGDLFLFLADDSDTLDVDVDKALHATVNEKLGARYAAGLSFRMGLYRVGEDRSFRQAYDRALLSLRHTKKHPYMKSIYYDEAMQSIEKLDHSIELHMQSALDQQEFHIFVQPKFSTSSETCCGGEVLVRWHSEAIGPLMPDQFIPLFEQNGFITEIDAYMLLATLKRQQWMQDHGKPLYPMAVNQSRVSISHEDYLSRVTQITKPFSVPLRYVEIEITESALADGGATLLQTIIALREIGFSIAMDDFGTGYSSLNILRTIPVDTLKIDREFLQAADLSTKDRTIIQSIIDMSRALDIHTVCEGVETSSQVEFLAKARCDVLQGYYLSKPIPFEDYADKYLMNTPASGA